MAKREKKLRLGLSGILVIFILGIVCAWGIFASINNGKTAETREELDSRIIEERLLDMQQLVVDQYQYRDVAELKADNYGNVLGFDFKIPLTYKFILLSYDGVANLSVDLEKAESTVSQPVFSPDGSVKKKGSISVKIPHVQILDNYIDNESVEVHASRADLFNPIQPEDMTRILKSEEERAEQRIRTSGILDKAESNARETILKLLSDFNGTDERYDVSVEFLKETDASPKNTEKADD